MEDQLEKNTFASILTNQTEVDNFLLYLNEMFIHTEIKKK